MSDANVGSIVASLSIDARAWQQGLQQASQQLTQFQAQIGQQARQGEATASQLLRAQSQAAAAAAREQMQSARLASQEAITGARTASAERTQALTEEVETLRAIVEGEREPWDDDDDRDW
jgi:hypothetical protein